MVIVIPRGARASPAEPDDRVGVTVGLGTPVGVIGVEGSHRIGDVDLGVGIGQPLGSTLVGAAAPQLAVMPRLLLGPATIGVGLSGGRFDAFSLDGVDADTYALWANAEVGAMKTFASGLFVRGFAGVGIRVADSGFDCVEGSANNCMDEASSASRWLPYLGATVGKAF